MANWDLLKASIAKLIRINGNQEITGLLLQGALANIISSVGQYATFAGVATPKTNPGAPDGPVFYLAASSGVYSNFDGASLAIGEAAVLVWRDKAWIKLPVGFSTQEALNKETQRAIDAEKVLSKDIETIKEAISNSGGEGGEGSKEVTRAEFELVKAQSKGTFDAVSELGMTEKADIDGYEIALAKSTNTAEKTKVKVPVFDTQNMAKNPVGLVDEIFVEDMANMMDEKIENALEDFTPPEDGGSNVTIVQETGASTTDVMSQKAVTDAIDAEKERAEEAERGLSEKIGDWIPNDYGKTITENLSTINKALEDSVPDEVPTEGSQSTVTSGGVYQAIEEAVDLIPVPDEEDVTKTEEGKLKFADREYDSLSPDGMGYVILRKNKALTEQITSNTSNTIYEIRYNFDLGGETVYVGSGCVFKFVGGKISNGVINVKNETINNFDVLQIEAGAYRIFGENLRFEGMFSAERIYIEWFGAVGNYLADDTEAFRYAMKMLNTRIHENESFRFSTRYEIYLQGHKVYRVTGSINYYDEKFNDVTGISFIGENNNEPYPASENRASCIKLYNKDSDSSKEVKDSLSFFKNATIECVRFDRVAVAGDWVNTVKDNIRFFDNCMLKGCMICNSKVSYIYSMFNNTGLWSVSRIYNNNFIGVYNFSSREGTVEDGDVTSANNWCMVDSSIYNNYINGGAPEAWKYGERNNRTLTTEISINGTTHYKSEESIYIEKGGAVVVPFGTVLTDSSGTVLYEAGVHTSSSAITGYIAGTIKNAIVTIDVITAEKVAHKGFVIDNAFFTWIEFDGSQIFGNFIDYYRVMYNYCPVAVHSMNNVYQVFQYFHTDCNIHSLNDKFRWTDRSHKAIMEVMDRYKKNTYTGSDGVEYDVPTYIASDMYSRQVVIENAAWEDRLGYAIYRTGFTKNDSNSAKLVFTLYNTKPESSGTMLPVYIENKIAYKKGSEYPVYYFVKTFNEVLIDNRLVTVSDAKPTLSNSVSGGWAKHGIGEHIKVGDKIYDVMAYPKDDGLFYIQFVEHRPTWLVGSRVGSLANAPGRYTGEVAPGTQYFATDLGLPVYFNPTGGWRYVNSDGYIAGKRSGTTEDRISLRPSANDAGLMFFDTTLGKVVVYNGSDWVNLDGSALS